VEVLDVERRREAGLAVVDWPERHGRQLSAAEAIGLVLMPEVGVNVTEARHWGGIAHHEQLGEDDLAPTASRGVGRPILLDDDGLGFKSHQQQASLLVG
jgi:hypothetical protein